MVKKAHKERISEKCPRIAEGSCVILHRLKISRDAVMKVRSNIHIRHPAEIPILSDKGLWGMVGLIDYIKTGDFEKILEPTLQRQVRKINAETWKEKAEKTVKQMP